MRRLACLTALALATCVACSRGAAEAEPAAPSPFSDQTLASGLDFVHFNGMSGAFYFAESMGPGVALFDHDADGDLDVFLSQGTMLGPGKTATQATFPYRGAPPLGDRLYRNELVPSGRLAFVDVTAAAGIVETGYGMGVATADYDRDGDVDLYVTNYGPNVLWENAGDGTFRDVTERSGTAIGLWSTSAAFVDYDADGWADLFVANYVDFSYANHSPCYSGSSAQDYCHPSKYEPYPSRLYRNRRDGTFEDVTAVAQIARHYGAGLGVASADFDRDGDLDLYVANDGDPSLLWLNRGDGTFEESGLLAGVALDENGKAEAGMGVAAGDFDNDADFDLIKTNLTHETHALYRNDGHGTFDDFGAETDLDRQTQPYTGFGTGWLDFDNDGWLDLFFADGAVRIIADLARQGDPYPLHQVNQLLRNVDGVRFQEIAARPGDPLALSEVSRGAAFGDIDNDGDTDILLTNNSGPARLLLNEVGNRRSWIGLRVLDAAGRVDALGAEIVIERAGAGPLLRHVHTDGSYLASHDPRVLVGLGASRGPVGVEVRFPDGSLERWSDLPAGRYTVLRQGSGERVAR